MTPLDVPAVPFVAGDDIASLVGRHAKEMPERGALAEGDREMTWRDLDAAVGRGARALEFAGIGRGQRIAILARNSIEYAVVFFAALRAGASVVPLPTMASQDALAKMILDSAPAALLVSRALADVGRSLPEVPLRVGLDFGDAAHTEYCAWVGSRDAPSSAENPAARPIAAEDEFDVIYSSGTTGVPKGIVHSHGARKASYAGSRSRHFSPETVNVVATPFYSNTTCITFLLTVATGGKNVILPKFSVDSLLDAVERHRATHAMLVPVQYDRLFESPDFPRRSATLKYLFSTSAPLRPAVKERILRELHAELVEIYGLTEGGPVTSLEARLHPDKLASVGRPSPGADVRIVDEAGRDVAAGEPGEVVGRSTNMMSGYLNRPEATAEMLWRDAEGVLYFKTGDIARFDEDGFLYLLDRKKDVIISGGFNVYASDLEAVLSSHPAVLEVAVIGVPSERWGETPLAVVVRKAGATADEAELRAYVNAKVGKAERVSAVAFTGALPKSAIGKVLKRELKSTWSKITESSTE